MDDTFIVTKNNNEAQNLLETFNRIHQAVTSTREENCSVFFLDVLVTERTDGS